MKDKRQKIIGIVGSGICDEKIAALAEETGRLIAEAGYTLLSGGLGGVMEAASKGAKGAGGLTIGILPGNKSTDANSFIDIPIVTGMGHARNIIVVHSADCIVAIAGEYGTLSEISIALKIGKPVIGIKTWGQLHGIIEVKTAAEAVAKLKTFI
ncbi:MAG: TIGR00725 family protein [Nitrospinae bacterium]|nr:TIGR00725 family protein [Nitrospinota bacterium]